jgi:preprotein translocase subunit SecF
MKIIQNRIYFFIFSLVIIIPGMIALILWGLKPSIDFSGGTLLELQFSEKQSVASQDVSTELKSQNLQDLNVVNTDSNTVLIRTKEISKDQVNTIKKDLQDKMGVVSEKRYESVGPIVSTDLAKKAIYSIILASLGIIIYIAISFRKMPRRASSFRFGICAIIALLHDLLFVIGIFAILGHYFNIEVDALFITALLTIMGFSVHDTIVVFDRLRENLRLNVDKSFEEVANDSVNQTIVRSLITSLTVLITLSALYIFGGTSIRYFVLALLIGIFIGTYSSIFVATPLLVVWQNIIEKRKKHST